MKGKGPSGHVILRTDRGTRRGALTRAARQVTPKGLASHWETDEAAGVDEVEGVGDIGG